MTPQEIRALDAEALDELVHEAKGAEAAAINNGGRSKQLAYLLAGTAADKLGDPCSTCGTKIGGSAIALAERHGWPSGEPQCLACIQEGVDRAALAEDERDEDFLADLAATANWVCRDDPPPGTITYDRFDEAAGRWRHYAATRNEATGNYDREREIDEVGLPIEGA